MSANGGPWTTFNKESINFQSRPWSFSGIPKRKAGNQSDGSFIRDQKRPRKEKPPRDPNDETGPLQRNRVTILKERLRNLERRHGSLPPDAQDPDYDAYALELRAFLRRKNLAQWPCPALDCNQNYTRKSHMKGHIMESEDAKHKLVKSVIAEIHCCYCGDEARDALIIATQQNAAIRNVWEPHSNGVTTPSCGLPLLVDGRLAYSPKDRSGVPTVERRGESRDQKVVDINPNLIQLAKEGLAFFSNSSYRSTASPKRIDPEIPGISSYLASDTERQKAQADGKLILTAVNKLKAESPSSARLPIAHHQDMVLISHQNLGMDMQDVGHSCVIQEREGVGYTPWRRQGDELGNSCHPTTEHMRPLSEVNSASKYVQGLHSSDSKWQGHSPRGSFFDTSDWKHPHSVYGPAVYRCPEQTGPIIDSKPKASGLEGYVGVKTEERRPIHGMLAHPQHEVRPGNTQILPYSMRRQSGPMPQWARNPSLHMSMYEGSFTPSILVHGPSNPQHIQADEEDFQPHHGTFEDLIILEPSTD